MRNTSHVAPTFVGRERELDALTAGLRHAVDGRGHLFLLAGEPGIGKTRLAGELATQAQDAGASVLWGRCWEGGGAPAYWPWVQVMRAALRLPSPEIAKQREEMATDLAPLFSQGPEGRDSTAPAPPELEHARFRLFDATSAFLQRAAAVNPLVLILDDLHAADQPSLLLLQFLARELRDSAILAIGTYRDVEVRRSPALADLFSGLGREAQRLPLSGLAVSDIARFMEQARSQPPAAVTQAVHEATAGNPFFVDELVRLLLAQPEWPETLGAEGFQLPDGVRDAIRRRLVPLGEETRRVLGIAALIGREFDLQVLERVAGLTGAALLGLLAEAAELAIVVEVPGTIARYSFVHALIRETLRQEMAAARRIQLHLEIAKALDTIAGGQLEPNLAELAHHYFQAAPAGGAPQALDYCMRAGDQAMQLLAYEEAVNHYERAAEALKFTAPDEIQRCELLLRLGTAQRCAARAAAASDTFRRAAALAAKLNAPEQLGRAALGYARWEETGLMNEAIVHMLEDALERLGPEDSSLRARLLGRLAMALYFSPYHERRLDLSREAVAMARRLGDKSALVAALVGRHFAIWGADSVGDREKIAAEIIRLGEESEERDLGQEGRLWRFVDLLEGGDIDAAEYDWEIFVQTAPLRLPTYRWHVEVVHATRALIEGRLEEAEQLSQRALAVGQQANLARAGQFFGVQLFQIRREQGRLAELEGAVRGFAEQYPWLPIWRCGLALLCIELGRADEAAALFDAVATQGFANLPRDGNWLPSLSILAEVCTSLGDTLRAEQLYKLLVPLASQNVLIAEFLAYRGQVNFFLGLLAATLLRWDDAQQHFDAALAMSNRLRAKLLVAHTQVAAAKVLRARGDPQRAEATLLEALRTYEQSGIAHRAQQTRALLESGPTDGRSAEAVASAASAIDTTGDADVDRARPVESVFRKDGNFWTVAFDGNLARLKDARGLAYIAYLLRHPAREFHATELVAAVQAASASPAASAAAEPLLDTQAKAAYRKRLRELKDELEEAEEFNDIGRIERARNEMELITRELSSALGIGGRDRSAPTDAERARIAVTKAITLIYRTIAEHNPPLREYFGNTIKTGRFCSYTPNSRWPVDWVL